MSDIHEDIDTCRAGWPDRNAALIALIGGEISSLTRVSEILQLVGARVGDHLGVTACVFVETDEAAGTLDVTHEWRRDSVPATFGKHRLRDYFNEEFQDSSRAGRTFVVSDTHTDPRTDPVPFAAFGIVSMVCVPILRGGIWKFSLNVHRPTPHVWSEEEVAFLTDLTPRVLDVLERVRAEETSNRLAAIVEYSEDAIISKDLNGIINSWNKGAEKVFGYTAREAVGRPVTMLIPPDRAGEEEEVIARIRKGESIEHYETVRRVKDGRLIDVALTVSPLCDIRGEIVGASKIARDITDRKRAQRDLAESELRLRAMYDGTHEYVGLLTTDGILLEANRTSLTFGNSTIAEVKGKPFWETVWFQNTPGAARLIEDAVRRAAAGESVRFETEIISPEGETRIFDLSFEPIRGSDGRIVLIVPEGRDITVRKRGERALLASETRFRSALGIVTSSVWTNNAQGMMEGEQPGWAQFTGQTREQYQGYGWSASIHPDDAQPTIDAWELAVAGKRLFEFEHRVRRHDGEWRWCTVRAVPVMDESGEISEWVGVHHDLTEHRRANSNATLLASISEDLLRLSPLGDLIDTLGGKLLDHLDLSRCTFARVDESADMLEIIHDYHRGAQQSLLGIYHLSDYVSLGFRQSAIAGELLVVHNTATDSRADEIKHRALGIGAFISVPLIRSGKLCYLFSVQHSAPHAWREDEVELIREVSSRLWTRLERSRSEEALAGAMSESERQRRLYHTVLSNTPDFIYVFDLNHRFTYINEALLKVYGLTWEEAKGRDWSGLGYEKWHADMHDREIDQVIATKAPIRGEIPFTGTSGRRIYDYIFTPVFGADGEVEAVAGTTRDVTERKQVEAAQAAERKVFEHIATGATLEETLDTLLRETESQTESGMVCSILLLDKAGHHLVHGAAPSLPESYNSAIHQLPVASSSGSCGTAAFQGTPVFVEDISTDPRWAAFRELAAAHQLAACFSMPILSLERKVLGTVAMYYRQPCRPDEHDIRLVTRTKQLAAIIIERKQTEESLAEQTASLVRAARSKDEFLAMLAHELRNPLAPIRNATEILQNAATPAADRDRALQLIARQTENMSRMIDDLLDVSRITEGKIELRRQTVELRTILSAAAEITRHACEAHGQTLTVSLPRQPVFLDADATRLEQLFGNLLGNACKYSGTGSHIRLTATVTAHQQAEVHISDDGAGIDPELLPRIFELFVQSSRTLDRSHGGLGIGLTIVDRLVKLHGGSIEAHSAGLGQGAEFIIRLPLLSGPAPAAEQEIGNHPACKSLRILIVDDNEDAAETLAMLQRLHGHDARTVHTGPAALELAAVFVPQVVILDIGLPEMDGFEVARRLRAMPHLQDAFLIALTGYGTENDRQRAKEAGFNEHLAKPADLKRLGGWLREL